MAYTPTTDFLVLLRQTPNGMRLAEVPGLDYLVAALARAGMFSLSVGQLAPTTNQATTAWFQPAVPSWNREGVLFLWNAVTVEYEPATPVLWAALFLAQPILTGVQDVTTVGPVAILPSATTVRVQNVGAPVTLTMGLAANAQRNVLITDWANHAGTNPITVTLSGGDIFPGGGNTWVIGADAGSIFLRPVPGGYAL